MNFLYILHILSTCSDFFIFVKKCYFHFILLNIKKRILLDIFLLQRVFNFWLDIKI